MSNFKLYFYGLGAKVIVWFGIIIIFIGLVVMRFTNEILGIIGIAIGIGIILFGKAMRFNYQRNSGNIIHRGDW